MSELIGTGVTMAVMLGLLIITRQAAWSRRFLFWIESWNSTTTNATIWANASFVQNNTNTTLYAYYGNFTLNSASNGSNTFDFFDDFPGTSLDTNKWDVNTSGGGGYIVNNSLLNIFCMGPSRSVMLTEKIAQSSQYYRVRSKTLGGGSQLYLWHGRFS